jgi:hypothetical protein
MTTQDISHLRRAIKQAKKYNMFSEFKSCYRSLNGCQYEDSHPYTVYAKCWAALYEWDLLTPTETDHGTFTLDF